MTDFFRRFLSFLTSEDCSYLQCHRVSFGISISVTSRLAQDENPTREILEHTARMYEVNFLRAYFWIQNKSTWTKLQPSVVLPFYYVWRYPSPPRYFWQYFGRPPYCANTSSFYFGARAKSLSIVRWATVCVYLIPLVCCEARWWTNALSVCNLLMCVCNAVCVACAPLHPDQSINSAVCVL